MAITVGASEIYATVDLLVAQANVHHIGKTIDLLIVQFGKRAFEKFNAGTKTTAARRPFWRVRPVIPQVSMPVMTELTQGELNQN